MTDSNGPRVGRLGVAELRDSLSERDVQILDHVSSLRLLCARQIEALLFPLDSYSTPATAARSCRRVLERLARERLLVRLERRVGGVRSGSASYIYGLSPLGQRVIDDGRPRRRLREPSSWFVDHTLAVADFLVDLTIEERRERWQLTDWQSEPTTWRQVATLGGRLVLRPDLSVMLAAGEFELRWFVEIDRGTEHLPALCRKCRLYNTYYKNGSEQRRHGVSPRVLWVVPSAERADRLRAAIDRDRRLTPSLFRVSPREHALEAIGDPL